MSRLPRLLHRTYSPRVMALDGGFAGLFQLDFSGPLFARRYDQPVLVACSDGVGTKLKVAIAAGRHETIGIDLVAMCVNDALCCGAEPLFFLDYVAMSRDNPLLLEQLVGGISEGCLQSDCALLGGETAIMPGHYADGDYDLAGFCVGVVERGKLINGTAIRADDLVVGIASSGLHANGYSLARKVVFEAGRLSVGDTIPELDQSVADVLLTPTRIYAHSIRRILRHYTVKNVVHGIAHITGGGLFENVERILPQGIQLGIQPNSWQTPAVYPWLRQLGELDEEEMYRVFNMGIGLVLIVRPFYAKAICQQLEALGERCWIIGNAREGTRGVVWDR